MMTDRILYSAGYSGLNLNAFCEFVERNNLVVADVRLKPVSRNPTWNRNALVNRLGARYTWIPELGNLNYKGGPIVLKAEADGFDKLRALLQAQSVVILCVCADAATCHRTVVAKRLAGEVTVRPLPSLSAPAPAALF